MKQTNTGIKNGREWTEFEVEMRLVPKLMDFTYIALNIVHGDNEFATVRLSTARGVDHDAAIAKIVKAVEANRV